MGAAPTAEAVRLRVWAPAAWQVEVELGNGQLEHMQAQGDGVWSGMIAEARPGTRYRGVQRAYTAARSSPMTYSFRGAFGRAVPV